MTTEKDKELEKATPMEEAGAATESSSEKRFKRIFFGVIAVAIIASVIIIGWVRAF